MCLSRGFPPRVSSPVSVTRRLQRDITNGEQDRSIRRRAARVGTSARSQTRVLCRSFATRRALVELESLEASLEKDGYKMSAGDEYRTIILLRLKFAQCFPLVDTSSERKRLLLQRKINLEERIFSFFNHLLS